MNGKGFDCAGRGGSGRGCGQGRGRGSGQGGGFGHRGPGGNCVCPDCGEKVPHKRGVPCVDMKCPKCGASMIRES